ncbi:N-6 DNA methylase [uncultured Polaribacter sp.]|uniref:HsdM family class I SAM-dependent methyltransferase n=1 Tax=uncultured Polaribacter sp. TaxID=174711 RepID=UPI00259B5374|nr:N-6 DNA methylase [uncultured Polaribacter sp.]
MIYDTYIRTGHKFLNPKYDLKLFNLFFKTVFRTSRLDKIIDKKKVKCIVVGTYTYAFNDAISIRIGIKKKIKVLEPGGFVLFNYTSDVIKKGNDFCLIDNNFSKIKNIAREKKIDQFLIDRGRGKKNLKHTRNIDIKTGETAFLFMQHFIKSLKTGGRAAVVIKNTVLSNTDNASVALRKLLLEGSNLHTILDLPGGTFTGAGVKTVVLFFQKGEPTKKIWYYQLDPGRKMGKTNPLNDKDMEEFVALQKTKTESEKSWTISVSELAEDTFDLSPKNPNTPEEAPLRSPEVILAEMETLDTETNSILNSIKALI